MDFISSKKNIGEITLVPIITKMECYIKIGLFS